MADNVAITAGTGTTIAADDIAGVLHQRVKISQGADGSATDVSSAAPLQVSLANTAANTNKLLVTPDLPTGAATAAKQPALGTAGSASTDVITVQGIASGTAQPVSLASVPSHAVTNAGTFAVQSAATQSGTWTVQPGNTANTTAWKVDGSAVTQPVSGTVTATIAAGATTIAKAEDAVHSSGDTGVMTLAVRNDAGTAFAADGDYVPLSVDSSGAVRVTGGGGGVQYTEGDIDTTITGTAILWEDASNTLATVNASKPLPVAIISGAGSGGTAAADDADFTATVTSGTPAMGVYESTPTSVTDGDMGIVGVTQKRAQKVTIFTEAGTAQSLISPGTAGTASADVVSIQGIASMTPLTVASHAVTNAGTFATQSAQSGTWTVQPGNTANTTAWKVDGSAVTQPVSLASVPSHAVTNAGTFATQVDGAALTSLQLIDDPVVADDAAFTPGTTKVNMAGYQADETSTDSVDEGDAGAARMTLDRKLIVTPQPHAAGGLSIFRSIDLDEGTLEVAKASPGTIYGMWITNTATTTRFVKFYDATSGTAGTGTPVITIGIPGNTADDVAGLFSSAHGIQFATGICVGATTAVADADTGAPGVNDVIINLFYK